MTITHRLLVARNRADDALYFACGRLPWVRRSRARDRQIASLKDDQALLLRTIERLTRPGVIGEAMKDAEPESVLHHGFTPPPPEVLADFPDPE